MRLHKYFCPGRAGSESEVRDSLLRIIEIKTNRILITSFASNVARMESVFYCAKKPKKYLFSWQIYKEFTKQHENVVISKDL